MLILALLSAFTIPDISGTGMFLSDLEPGVPMPAVMFAAPFSWSPPVSEGLYFRAGFEAGGRESFHCRGNGATAGRSFFSAGWFSPDGWAYGTESRGLFRFTAAGVRYASTDLVLLETASDRLSLGFLSDSGGTAPVVLWETPAVTGAAGSRGAGMGFAVSVAPWLMLGPAVTGDGPWVKSSIRLGLLEIQSGPGTDRSGGVRGMARAEFRGRNWLLGVFYNGDSLVCGGTAVLMEKVVVSAAVPEPGFSAAVELGGLTLSTSTLRGEEWSAGAAFSLPVGTLSAWGLFVDKWEAGIGLELGKGEDFGGQPGLPLRR
ncbi:MAG: hypothetical protein R6V62_08050 [Candidatus Fermentibacteraceae bacterium]